MGNGVNGLSGKSCPKYILGYTSDETVMLDFDEATLGTVKYWARRAMNRFNLGGFLVLESSPGSFHVVFDRTVGWGENMRVVAWVALLSGKEKLRRWFLMQCIKMKPTLRVSGKSEVGDVVKAAPWVVWFEGSQSEEVSDYLRYRDLILNT